MLPELFSLQESHLSWRFNRAEGCPVACRDIFSLQRRASGMIDQQSYTSPAPVLHFLAQKRSSGCPAGAKAALPRHLLCSLCKGDTRLRWLMVFPGPRWTKFPPFAGAHRGKVTNSSSIHPCALGGGGCKGPVRTRHCSKRRCFHPREPEMVARFCTWFSWAGRVVELS